MRRGTVQSLKGMVMCGLSLLAAACGSSPRVAGVAMGVGVASTAGCGGERRI